MVEVCSEDRIRLRIHNWRSRLVKLRRGAGVGAKQQIEITRSEKRVIPAVHRAMPVKLQPGPWPPDPRPPGAARPPSRALPSGSGTARGTLRRRVICKCRGCSPASSNTVMTNEGQSVEGLSCGGGANARATNPAVCGHERQLCTNGHGDLHLRDL